MLTVNDAIYGWSPIGDGDVEVNVSQDMCFMAVDPITSSAQFLNPVCPLQVAALKPCLPHTSPPSESAALTNTVIAPSSNRRAQRNRSHDPSWIPRPRNAFIIFRCEYSRAHAQGSLESKETDQDASAAVKTLSRRAAEAWKELPIHKRERYKVLADREREEHARLYPCYQFRPMKRGVLATRDRSCVRSRNTVKIADDSDCAHATE